MVNLSRSLPCSNFLRVRSTLLFFLFCRQILKCSASRLKQSTHVWCLSVLSHGPFDPHNLSPPDGGGTRKWNQCLSLETKKRKATPQLNHLSTVVDGDVERKKKKKKTSKKKRRGGYGGGGAK